MSHKFTSRARWVCGTVAGSVLLLGTIATAQFRVFQLTVPSENSRDAAAAAAAAIATGESTTSVNKVPRQTVAQRAAELAAKCPSPLPTSSELRTVLGNIVSANKNSRRAESTRQPQLPSFDPRLTSAVSGGLDTDMWGVVVNRRGEVCAVAFSGSEVDGSPGADQQWLGSRVIAAQKANTANSFSLPNLALSSANLFFPTQNGQSLFGLQHSNPVDPSVAYSGVSDDYGTENDPMVLKKVGGINVFGGGLALYSTSASPTLIGAIGVSGDTSCADHILAWKTRFALNLDNVPAGVGAASGGRPSSDNMIGTTAVTVGITSTLAQDIRQSTLAIGGFTSTSGFGHPTCGIGTYSYSSTGQLIAVSTSATSTVVINNLVTGFPTGPNP